jgi:hypothetical protein
MMNATPEATMMQQLELELHDSVPVLVPVSIPDSTAQPASVGTHRWNPSSSYCVERNTNDRHEIVGNMGLGNRASRSRYDLEIHFTSHYRCC